MVIIDPKQSFVLSDRRESEQKEGFIVPDQRERFLVADATWSKTTYPTRLWGIVARRCSPNTQTCSILCEENLRHSQGNYRIFLQYFDLSWMNWYYGFVTGLRHLWCLTGDPVCWAFLSNCCFFSALLVLVVFTPSWGGMSYWSVVSSSPAHKLNSSHCTSCFVKGWWGLEQSGTQFIHFTLISYFLKLMNKDNILMNKDINK